MGAVSTVCTVAVYAWTYTQYYQNGTAPKSWPSIVNGGQCHFVVSGYTGDIGDTATFYNTSIGPATAASVVCTIDSSGGCKTPDIPWNANPYSLESFELEEFNNTAFGNGKLDLTYNFTLVALPPVPSQTPLFNFVNNRLAVNVSTSQWSQEYGSAIIGCVMSAGKTPYFGKDLPTYLSSTPSSNSLPFNSLAYYAPAQGMTQTINLQDLNVGPNALWDLHWNCWNANGMSPDTAMYNIQTSASLPTPQSPPTPKSNAAAKGAASLSVGVGAGLLLLSTALLSA